MVKSSKKEFQLNERRGEYTEQLMHTTSHRIEYYIAKNMCSCFFSLACLLILHTCILMLSQNTRNERGKPKSAVIVPWHFVNKYCKIGAKERCNQRVRLQRKKKFKHTSNRSLLLGFYFVCVCVCNVFLAKMIKSLQE